MVKKYTDDEVAEMKAFYHAHGVVHLKGLLDAETVDMLLSEIDKTAARVNEKPVPGQGLSYGTAPGRMTIRHQWRENPKVRKFLLDAALVDVMARIVDTEELRFWFDLTFMHDGSPDGETGTGTPWHHDIGAFAWKGDQMPSLWMALTPANRERSRIEFIDGSHTSAPGYYRPESMAAGDDGYLAIPDFDKLVAEGKEKIITWDCDPGDAVILHPYVIHGSVGNKGVNGAGRRVAITTRWFGDDVRFLPTTGYKGNGIPGVTESPIAVGGKPRGKYFPLVWTRSGEVPAQDLPPLPSMSVAAE
jgi:ectoine hydroxylase-related dioxygenase (phytanoyl-CoA dioxygenase family)